VQANAATELFVLAARWWDADALAAHSRAVTRLAIEIRRHALSVLARLAGAGIAVVQALN
jgi:hypothetical protein